MSRFDKQLIPLNMILWRGKSAVLRGDEVPELENAIYLGPDPDHKAWFWVGPNDVRSLPCETLAQYGLIYKRDPMRGYKDGGSAS